MRVNLPPHTLGPWNVGLTQVAAQRSLTLLRQKHQVKDGQTQLTITMDHLPSDVSSIK